MTMRTLTVVFGALTALALGACKIEGTGGVGGGTSGDSTTSGSTTGGVGGGATSSATGTGGAAACDMSVHCAAAITDGTGDKICDGTESATLYDAYVACTCTAGGACFMLCGDNYCDGKASTTECTGCLQDNTVGCKKEGDACNGDV
jgi:hypothetical protein